MQRKPKFWVSGDIFSSAYVVKYVFGPIWDFKWAIFGPRRPGHPEAAPSLVLKVANPSESSHNSILCKHSRRKNAAMYTKKTCIVLFTVLLCAFISGFFNFKNAFLLAFVKPRFLYSKDGLEIRVWRRWRRRHPLLGFLWHPKRSRASSFPAPTYWTFLYPFMYRTDRRSQPTPSPQCIQKYQTWM